MSTIDSWPVIDEIIRNDGYYMGDPRVYMIVEYKNYAGTTTWGVTWEHESEKRRVRYMIESDYVHEPKVIWQQSARL